MIQKSEKEIVKRLLGTVFKQRYNYLLFLLLPLLAANAWEPKTMSIQIFVSSSSVFHILNGFSCD